MWYFKTEDTLGFRFGKETFMQKGSKRKSDIQHITKELIIEKGYTSVTMTDIGQRMQLSVGGLYYHYHSVEEILLDLIANETGDVWGLFHDIKDFDSLMTAFKKYWDLEKADMLNFENTLNSILYQYYFSFPEKMRREKMKADYKATTSAMTAILQTIYKNPQTAAHLSDHIYVMLHGLNVLAMSGQLRAQTIDQEFYETEKLMRNLYTKSE